MTEYDSPAFTKAILVMAEVFGEQLSEARIEAYFLALHDLPWSSVDAAIGHAIKAAKFFPRPAELREYAAGGAPAHLAELAWVRFNEALRAFDARDAVYCEPAAIAQTVEQVFGGWPEAYHAWAYLPEAAWQGKRKEFAATFQVLAAQPQRVIGRALPGTWTTALSPGGRAKYLSLAEVGETTVPRRLALTEGEEDGDLRAGVRVLPGGAQDGRGELATGDPSGGGGPVDG